MYFRRSLKKIVKVRPLASSLRSYRYSHTGCARLFSLLKYLSPLDKNDRNPFSSYIITRNIYVENYKTDGKRNEKTVLKPRTVGIDLMAPNMRSNHFISKCANKDRNEAFHAMPQKSLTLKICRPQIPQSKNLSTSQFKDTKEKTEMKNEANVSKISKAEICQAICGPNSPISTSETCCSSPPNHSERLIDKLTDAEIEEICKERCACPCRKCHVLAEEREKSSETVAQTDRTEEKLKDLSTVIKSKEKLENSSTAIPVIQSSQKMEDSSTNIKSGKKLEASSKTIKSNEKLENSSTVIPSSQKLQDSSTNINLGRKLEASSKTIQSDEKSSTVIQSSQKFDESTAAIQSAKKLSKTLQSKENLKDSSTEDRKSMAMGNLTKNEVSDPGSLMRKKFKSKHSSMTTKNMRMKKNRSGDSLHKTPLKMPFMNNHQRLNQHRDNPRYVIHVNDARRSPPTEPRIGQNNLSRYGQISAAKNVPPMQTLQLGATSRLRSFYGRMMRSRQPTQASTRYRLSHQLKLPPGFQTKNARNVNPSKGFTESVCHFEQLKPVPFRSQPIYGKNYHSDPVIENCDPRFNAMPLGVPYKAFYQPQWHNRQRIPKKSAVFGNKISKNRQTFDSQVNKWIPNPLESSAKMVNSSNTTVDIGKITMPEKVLNMNVNVNKAQLVNSAGVDTAQQSRKIMSKLIENLSVVIDGPTKLKLVTLPYPQLRNEKDVIIQMEYVNLTDADTRHYLTGKYSSYSYATTAVGRTGSGTVIETGRNVHNVKPGDKVFVKPVSCGKCSSCLSDRRNICEYITASEMSPIEGVLSRLHVHSSDSLMKVPDNVSILNGAMTWTLSTAIRACQKAAVSAGDVVVVIGGGPLATATALSAQTMGATTVCLTDTRKPFLDEAQKLGIESVFLIDPKSPNKNTAIKICEQIGEYPRLTFDCRGSQFTNELAINVTKTGGKVVIMTNSENGFPLPITNIVTRDIDIIISTFGNDDSDIAALRFLSTKKTFFSNFMNKHYDLSNVEEAFQHLYGPNRLDSQIIVKCGCKCVSQVKSGQKETDR